MKRGVMILAALLAITIVACKWRNPGAGCDGCDEEHASGDAGTIDATLDGTRYATVHIEVIERQ